MEPWATDIREITRRPNVFCKLSGMVTEAGTGWDIGRLRPYMDTVLEAFGPERLMSGSDWPVCLFDASYPEVFDPVREWADELSDSEQAQIFGGNAISFYNLQLG
ncbi:MAG: amidohydrolase family protein [Armatimonadetes bacterium]|nr:amidohydrolase family protein [Armatimonadota bacterium]